MSSLYDTDFYRWTQEQAKALRRAGAARINTPVAIDWENVAEEIESMGKAAARELRWHFATLLAHLLKWQHQAERRSRSWEITIRRERRQIAEHLEENPGLKPRMAELFERAYLDARDDAAIETGLPPESFSATCPYSLDRAMADEFWPGPPPASAEEAQVEVANESSRIAAKP
jgi:hypothetical protein